MPTPSAEIISILSVFAVALIGIGLKFVIFAHGEALVFADTVSEVSGVFS